MKPFLVTIDGPAGAGKTTVSKMLSQRLGYRYIDTGALYRAVALKAIASGLSPDDDEGLEKLCRNLKLEFIQNEKGLRLYADGADITDQIRTPVISMFASAASARAVVRQYMMGLQRNLGNEKGAVFEGRDMGTVVFPNAEIKFFLDALPRIRALRRFQELNGANQTLEEVERDLNRRDENDSSRVLAPLKPSENAIIIDTSSLSAEQVVEKMLFYIENRLCGLTHPDNRSQT
jgi:cytidylate kinase